MEWKSWINWCRLCGKIENQYSGSFMVLECNLLTIIKKCFAAEMFSDSNTPINVCPECLKFTIKLKQFAQQCTKVDKMFTYLIAIDKLTIQQKSLLEIRNEYKIDWDESVSITQELAHVNTARDKYNIEEERTERKGFFKNEHIRPKSNTSGHKKDAREISHLLTNLKTEVEDNVVEETVFIYPENTSVADV